MDFGPVYGDMQIYPQEFDAAGWSGIDTGDPGFGKFDDSHVPRSRSGCGGWGGVALDNRLDQQVHFGDDYSDFQPSTRMVGNGWAGIDGSSVEVHDGHHGPMEMADIDKARAADLRYMCVNNSHFPVQARHGVDVATAEPVFTDVCAQVDSWTGHPLERIPTFPADGTVEPPQPTRAPTAQVPTLHQLQLQTACHSNKVSCAPLDSQPPTVPVVPAKPLHAVYDAETYLGERCLLQDPPHPRNAQLDYCATNRPLRPCDKFARPHQWRDPLIPPFVSPAAPCHIGSAAGSFVPPVGVPIVHTAVVPTSVTPATSTFALAGVPNISPFSAGPLTQPVSAMPRPPPVPQPSAAALPFLAAANPAPSAAFLGACPGVASGLGSCPYEVGNLPRSGCSMGFFAPYGPLPQSGPQMRRSSHNGLDYGLFGGTQLQDHGHNPSFSSSLPPSRRRAAVSSRPPGGDNWPLYRGTSPPGRDRPTPSKGAKGKGRGKGWADPVDLEPPPGGRMSPASNPASAQAARAPVPAAPKPPKWDEQERRPHLLDVHLHELELFPEADHEHLKPGWFESLRYFVSMHPHSDHHDDIPLPREAPRATVDGEHMVSQTLAPKHPEVQVGAQRSKTGCGDFENEPRVNKHPVVNFQEEMTLKLDKLDQNLVAYVWGKKASVTAESVTLIGRSLAPLHEFEFQRRTTTWGVFDVMEGHRVAEMRLRYVIASTPGPIQEPKLVESKQTSVNVKWEPPETDHGAPVLGYKIGIWLDADTNSNSDTGRWHTLCECTKSKNPVYVVASLAGNTTYTLDIKAVNKVGAGDERQFQVTTAPVSPNPPGKPWIEEFRDGCINVAWKPPLNDGGFPITAYKVRMRKLAGATTFNQWHGLGPGESNATWIEMGTVGSAMCQEEDETSVYDAWVGPLDTESCEYRFQVFALNRAGEGQGSELSDPHYT